MKALGLKSLVVYLAAFALAWVALSVPAIPKHWVALAIAAGSFGAAAYYGQHRTSRDTTKAAPWVFVLFGCVAVGLAIGMWISPPSAPTAVMWFGMLSGVLLAGLAVALLRRGKRAPGE